MGMGRMSGNYLASCGESEHNLKMILECYDKVCMRRGLKVNEDKSNVVVLHQEEGLESEICVDGA